MKTKLMTLALALSAFCAPAYALDIKDLLSGSTGETIGNIIEGVFTKSDLDVKDLAGTWQSTGSAVTFKSENFLQKAGGIAGAAAIESKLDPYFEKYGLIGSTLEVAEDGTFSLKVKKLTLKGTITKGDGVFEFNFQAFGKVGLGKMTAYVEKSPSSLNVMFDASKLKTLVSTIATFSGMQLAKTASSILDSYDGACIGFKMKSIGAAPASQNGETTPSATEGSAESATSKGTELLRSILGGKK